MGKVVTHTCVESKWVRKVNGGVDTVEPTPEDWEDKACNACEKTPLHILPEPGLSLICLNPLEGVLNSDHKYEASHGFLSYICTVG
jgi:hypothetical protein